MDDTAVDGTAEDVSGVVMVDADDVTVAGTVEEGSEAVEMGAASVVG